jgi:hypothetical protein
MSFRNSIAAIALQCAVCPLASASEFATTVVHYVPGSGASGSFPATLALGGPQGGGLGGGSLHVATLGAGGALTLGFAVTLRDGPGADLIVSENGFAFGNPPSVFAEVCFVEVSSDGTNFARFESRQGSPVSGTPMATYRGLGGGLPVIANVVTHVVPPEDPVRSGGDAFDLAELGSHPLVGSGQLDLGNVNFVRLVDAMPGDVDSYGTPIVDAGSADVDAVTVINHVATVTPNQPICDLAIDSNGFVELRLGDPDGFFDLDLGELRASIDLVPVDFFLLLNAFQIQSFDGRVAVFRTPVPVDGAGIFAAFAVSVADAAGGFSGDQVRVQG